MGLTLYNHLGESIKTKSINLEPSFFQLSPNMNLSTDDLMQKPYQHHAWVHACAWVIARNISHLPIMLVDKSTEKEQVEDRWGILDLLSSPNSIMTRTTFFQFVVLGLVLSDTENGSSGQVFIQPKSGNDEKGYKVNLHKGEIPDLIFPYTSRFFEPRREKKNNGLESIVGWNFKVNGKSVESYGLGEIIRIYLANPYDWLGGISNFAPAKIAVVQDIKADLYNSALYDNSATPAGVLSSDSLLTNEQKKMAMESWMEEYGGSANAAKVAVLGKGLKFQRIALTQQDMQFTDSKKHSLEQIISSFGLNKIALGMYEDINFATIREGRKMLWQDTYLPLARQIIEAINSQWVFHIDKNIALKFDTSNIEALRPDYKDRMEVADKMIRDGVPVELAFRINEIPLSENDIKEYPWLSQKPEALPKTTAINPTNDEDEKENKNKKPKSKSFTRELLTNDEKFSELFISKVLDPGERDLQRKIERFFNSQRNRMQDRVDNWVKLNSQNLKTLKTPGEITPEMFLLDGINENESLEKLLTKPIKDQLKRTENELKEELDDLIGWGVTDDTVISYMSKRRDVIKGINTTTFNAARNEIADAIEESFSKNETVQQAAKRIKESIGDALTGRKGQAKTIARTEIGTVTSSARFDAFKKEGVEYHRWITAQDEHVRESHVLTHAEVVRVGEAFSPVGLSYPLEMGGRPEEVINCRCITVPASNPKGK